MVPFHPRTLSLRADFDMLRPAMQSMTSPSGGFAIIDCAGIHVFIALRVAPGDERTGSRVFQTAGDTAMMREFVGFGAYEAACKLDEGLQG